jgi:hypothetical protein
MEKSEKFSLLTYNMNPTLAKGKVYRMPEKTARIWINSFTDEKGDYVGETYVHTVISPGAWKEGSSE